MFISYLDREVTFVVIEYRSIKALKVTKILNSNLKEGDILLIQYLEIGKILEAKESYRDNLVGNYRTNSELSEIPIA